MGKLDNATDCRFSPSPDPQMSVSSSAFGIDLSQMTRALVNSTKNSLVLVDEFGKVCWVR